MNNRILSDINQLILYEICTIHTYLQIYEKIKVAFLAIRD